MRFTFSDLIAGYVQSFDWVNETIKLETTDHRIFVAKLSDNCFAELVRNLGEAYMDCTSQIKDMLQEGRYIYVYGVFYPDGENGTYQVEAKHIVFLGREVDEYRFEKQDWWIKQIQSLANFYMNAQFADGDIDYRKYRTVLTLEGDYTNNVRQETDTISRLVYGFATAYMMTGEDRYLEAAEKGTEYLINHMCNIDPDEDIAFWYHGVDVKGNKERKIFASEFGDDYDAIPAYEQIYALAGLTQTYRLTGKKETLDIINKTINLFDKYFLDREKEGYFSHIDPITFSPRSESLGKDRARKNWNSVGDHAPAYLINLCLATDDERYKKMLKYTADTVEKYFQDYDHSPFVQEKFHEDWSHDQTWGWQQNRAVVGHNLKIAWNLMRVNSMHSNEAYEKFAEKIASLMPMAGSDLQRGGWYDVVNRELKTGEEYHRFAWHDRKAWWQQEQAILAYLILAGILKKDEYLKYARESASFYNAWFLDHDSGGVYFNVLANGLPYLLGNERLKGSHSMSGYHSFELAFLAAVYTNLLITKQPMQFYFKPYPNSLKDHILRVHPDILPTGSVKIESVTIDGKRYENFDADQCTITMPDTEQRFTVCVTIAPTEGVEHFNVDVQSNTNEVFVRFNGILDQQALPTLKESLVKVISINPEKVVLDLTEIETHTHAGIRAIIFESQKLDIDCEISIVGASEEIKQLFINEKFDDAVTFMKQ